MFERFTDRARGVLTLAQEEARLLNHSFIGTEHLLLGLIREEGGLAGVALGRCGITLEAARYQVEKTIGMAGTAPSGSPPFTPRAKRALEMSLREALDLNHGYIGTEHLLLGLIREGEGVWATVVQNLGVDMGDLRQMVIALMSGTADDIVGTHADLSPSVKSRDIAVQTDPPRCPRCRAGLVDSARYRVIDVATEDPEADEPILSVRVVYCSRCGYVLGIV